MRQEKTRITQTGFHTPNDAAGVLDPQRHYSTVCNNAGKLFWRMKRKILQRSLRVATISDITLNAV